MKTVTFITGNEKKAEYLAKYLGHPVEHQKLDLDEIQSLDLKEIIRHKVRQAYEQVKKPVLVEDISLEFAGLSGLPGPFIKWFLESLSEEELCRLVDGKDRSVTARCMYGYFDGKQEKIIEGVAHGTVAQHPAGTRVFGWNVLFIPKGYEVTMAEISEEDFKKVYLKIRPFAQLKTFLESLV